MARGPCASPEHAVSLAALKQLLPPASIPSLRVLSIGVGAPEVVGVSGIEVNPWIDAGAFPPAPWSAEDAEELIGHGVALSATLALRGETRPDVQHELLLLLHALVQKSGAARDQLNAHHLTPLSLGSTPTKGAAALAAAIRRACKERLAEAGQQVACRDWTEFGSVCEVWLGGRLDRIKIIVRSEPNKGVAAFDLCGERLTGGRVWGGALVLSRWLASLHSASDFRMGGHDISLGEGPVLELGAGLGIAGLCLAKLGRRVVLSDRELVLLDRLQQHAEVNGVQDRCRVLALDWAEAGTGRTRRMLQAQRFSAVIGADVVYEENHADLLVHVLSHALPRGGAAYFTNARRHRPGILGFADKLRGAGHTVYEQHIPCDRALQDLVCGSFEPDQEYVALAVIVAASQ